MREADAGGSAKGGLLVPGITFCLVLAADQITKYWIARAFPLYRSCPVWGNFIRLTHVRNPGGVFGIPLGGPSPVLPIILSLVLLVVLYFMRFSRGQLLKTVALALIAAGACGNLIDRIRFGAVIDFVDVGISRYRWPVFNIADSAVTVGVLLIMVLATRSQARRRAGEGEAGVTGEFGVPGEPREQGKAGKPGTAGGPGVLEEPGTAEEPTGPDGTPESGAPDRPG